MNAPSPVPSPNEPSRFANAAAVIEFYDLLFKADDKRSKQRAITKGLIDGNPPYNTALLFEEGQGGRCNVNFREAESYVNKAVAAFYDLSSEAPTLTTIKATTGDPNKRVEWSNCMTEKFSVLEKGDSSQDFRKQISQHEMVVFGTGPLFWENPLDWRPTAIRSGQLYVPDKASSDIQTWETCAIQQDYSVSKLFEFIEHEDAATQVGWNVGAVKKSIKDSTPINKKTGTSQSWEEIQQCLRNNDILQTAQSNAAKCAHVLFKEKDKSISRIIVDLNNKDGILFHRKSEYKNWKQALSAMYYDRGDGGHHSIKGLAIKMYGAIEIKNRLKNMSVDAGVLRTKLLLIPKDSAAAQNMQILPRGDSAILPPNSEVVQQNLAGVLDAPLAIDQLLDTTITANLSQYRQSMEKDGNPRTATEIEAIIGQQSSLGKTQLTRYYQQMDDVAAEQYRRVVNNTYTENSGHEHWDLALAYMKDCREAGVPLEVIKSAKAMATRVVGQGNPFMRIQTLTDLLGAVGMLPEGGRKNLIDDWVAAKVGQENVKRYNPSEISGYEQDQVAWAVMENGMFKDGLMPLVTGSQSHLIHARQHITDGASAVGSLEENPGAIAEVAAYLQVLLPHAGQHMQAMQQDPTRKAAMQSLIGQFNQLAQVANDLIQGAAQQQGGQSQGQAQGGPSEEQLKMVEFQAEQARKDKALEEDLRRKDAKLQHTLAISDAKTAHSLATKPAAQA